jgi:hypothetical protein
MQFVGIFPSQKYLRGRSCIHCQRCTDGNRVAQSRESFSGCDADAHISLAAIELCALTRRITKCGECGGCSGKQSIFTSRCGELARTRTEDEATIEIAGNETMKFQSDSKSVCGWSSNFRSGNKFRE